MKTKREGGVKERLLAELVAVLAAPSAELPTTRCLSEPQLSRIILSLRDRLAAQGVPGARSTTAVAFIDYLQQVGLAQVVPTGPAGSGRQSRPPVFYVLGIEKDSDGPQVSPEEMLQAHRPDGFLCYFTALAFHGLTTQRPAFHHVAVLRPKSSQLARDSSSPRTSGSAARRAHDPLGEFAFTFDGLPYYVTRRDPRFAPGIQSRYLGSRTILRITTREQTLLDTLHRPQSCGGAEVVFESWERGAGDINEDALAAHLRSMAYDAAVRRTGAMLGLLGHQIKSAELEAVLAPLRNRADEPIPLLAGIKYHRLDSVWSVQVT